MVDGILWIVGFVPPAELAASTYHSPLHSCRNDWIPVESTGMRPESAGMQINSTGMQPESTGIGINYLI